MNVRQLADTFGSGFQPPVELVPPADGTIRKDLFVEPARSREPPFRVFGDAGASPMRAVRFGGGLATRATKEGLQIASSRIAQRFIGTTVCDRLRRRPDRRAQRRSRSIELVREAKLLAGGRRVAAIAAFRPVATGRGVLRRTAGAVAAAGNCAPMPPWSPALPIINRRPPTEYGRWEWSAEQGSLVWSWAEPAGAGVYQLSQERPRRRDDGDGRAAGRSQFEHARPNRAARSPRRLARSGLPRSIRRRPTRRSLWNWLIVGCVLVWPVRCWY